MQGLFLILSITHWAKMLNWHNQIARQNIIMRSLFGARFWLKGMALPGIGTDKTMRRLFGTKLGDNVGGSGFQQNNLVDRGKITTPMESTQLDLAEHCHLARQNIITRSIFCARFWLKGMALPGIGTDRTTRRLFGTKLGDSVGGSGFQQKICLIVEKSLSQWRVPKSILRSTAEYTSLAVCQRCDPAMYDASFNNVGLSSFSMAMTISPVIISSSPAVKSLRSNSVKAYSLPTCLGPVSWKKHLTQGLPNPTPAILTFWAPPMPSSASVYIFKVVLQKIVLISFSFYIMKGQR